MKWFLFAWKNSDSKIYQGIALKAKNGNEAILRYSCYLIEKSLNWRLPDMIHVLSRYDKSSA